MKIRYQDVLQRITGISTPAFGISWNPPALDRDIVKQVLAFLEDRRALYNPYDMETPDYVERSILEIRATLSDALGKVEKNSVAGEAFTVMRRACREFLDEAEHSPRTAFFHPSRNSMEYFIALGKLRTLFGVQIARLSVAYGIDLEDELTKILPPNETHDAETDEHKLGLCPRRRRQKPQDISQ
jgi:hypothetical protein